MADVSIPDLAALGANVADGDLFEIADISDSDGSKKATRLEIIGLGSTGITTLGTITTGTWTGTTIAVARGGTGLTSGTSGGVLAFTASGTLASSGALAANAIVIGGGAGVAPSTTTTGTGVLTALGVNTNAGGGVIALADPGADRIVFWDDSAGAYTHLTVGSGLDLTDTTLTATGSGSGDVVGPASSTDTAIALFDGATGVLLQNSVVLVDPVTGDMTGVGDITGGALAVSAANPVSNDGAALGTTALGWSDLHLATGALINVANGNAVITHSSGIFTVSTGDFRVTTAGTNAASVLTLNGTQTASNKSFIAPVLGTPTSGTLTNCTGLPASGIAAGILGGNITLGESTGQIILDPTLSADGTWSGIMMAGTAGATLAFGDLIYLAVADSRWELADADAASTSGDVILGICVLAAAADGDPTNILLYGKVRADAAFPALTVGAPVYAGTTAGDIQVAQPSGTDDVIRVVGFAQTADVLVFQPAGMYITHT